METVLPLTAATWADFEALFGAKGACAGCWCMHWRRPARAFESGKGAGNRSAMEALVYAGQVPGLIGYVAGVPVAWCALGPRTDFPRLLQSRSLRSPDALPAWVLPCLFIARSHRRQGMSRAMISAAADYARAQGAPALDAFPIDSDTPYPDAFAWTGIAQAFRSLGFAEIARHSPSRPIVRLTFS